MVQDSETSRMWEDITPHRKDSSDWHARKRSVFTLKQSCERLTNEGNEVQRDD